MRYSVPAAVRQARELLEAFEAQIESGQLRDAMDSAYRLTVIAGELHGEAWGRKRAQEGQPRR